MDLNNWKNYIGNTLDVRVRAGASSNRIKPELDAEGRFFLRIHVTTIAEDGKANKAVIALLSQEFSLRKSAFTILQGHTYKHKLILIDKN